MNIVLGSLPGIYKLSLSLPAPSYLRVEDKVFWRAHLLVVGVRRDVDAGGLMSVVAAEDCRGNVGTGEIHLRRQVLWRIQPRHVGGVHAEVGRVVVKERKRARQMGLLVDHLEKTLWRQELAL